MNKKLKCIMLVDDSADDNFIHERAIKKFTPEITIISKLSATEALEYLKSKKDPHPELLFLDINMPGLNGWDFLQEYSKLSTELQSRVTIIMLSTSDNDRDIEKAKEFPVVSEYIVKPLTEQIMGSIVTKYFQ